MNAKRTAIAFIDGQNLFRCAKEAYSQDSVGSGYHYPTYDVMALSRLVADRLNLDLTEVRFYSGIPNAKDDALESHIWMGRIRTMRRSKVKVIVRDLHCRDSSVIDSDTGQVKNVKQYREKGIDVRIALDMVSVTIKQSCEALILFSQDSDLKEAIDDIREISGEQRREVLVVCAFPSGSQTRNRWSINGTTAFQIQQQDYDQCRDLTDYRKGFSSAVRPSATGDSTAEPFIRKT